MTAAVNLTDLQTKLQDLQELHQDLLQELKEKHKDVYDWLVANGIDVNNLKKYAKPLAAAFVVTLSMTTYSVKATAYYNTKSQQHFERIQEYNISNFSQEDKNAYKVWQKYGGDIVDTAARYDLDPKLIFATIMVESGGRENAMRYEPHLGESSHGMGQILFSTAKYLGFNGSPQELADPKTNIDMIGRYHKRSLTVYGAISTEELALAYNTGSPHNKWATGYTQKFSYWYNKAGNFMVF